MSANFVCGSRPTRTSLASPLQRAATEQKVSDKLDEVLKKKFKGSSARSGAESDDLEDRNFLWVLSSNVIGKIEVCHASVRPLLALGVAGTRFCTVDENNFGLQLGSVYLFPGGGLASSTAIATVL